MIVAGTGPCRRLQAQLQLLLGIGGDDRRADRLPAAEKRRFPAVRHLRHRKLQLLRRMVEIAQRQIDRRGLACAHSQRRVARCQVCAGDTGRLIGGSGRDRRRHEKQDRDKPPPHIDPSNALSSIHAPASAWNMVTRPQS